MYVLEPCAIVYVLHTMYGYRNTSGVVFKCWYIYAALTINPEYRERRGKCISFVYNHRDT